MKWISAFGYLFSIMIGNILVDRLGIVNFAGLTFPAGVVFIGLTFSFRDFAQRSWGDAQVWIWMIIACMITVLFNQSLALASFLAFSFSETVDWFCFKYLNMPFRKRIYISNLFSTPIDSLIFVILAFGWYPEAIFGQAIIKYASGLLVLPFVRR